MVRDEHKVVLLSAIGGAGGMRIPIDGTIVRSEAAELAHVIESMISKHQMDGLTDLDRYMVLYTAVYVVKPLALMRVRLAHGRTDCKFCLTITNHPDDVLNDDEMGLFYRILIARQKKLLPSKVKIPLSCCAAMKMERRCYGRWS
ncbi:Biotin synthase [Trichinella spiralis]|uniref:Biotin synthase n=1 Tax=Trichinella spiralis TaxID=6334 RepID=A0ABR3KHJ2_TRISP